MIDFTNKLIFKLKAEPIETGVEKVKDILVDGERVVDSYVTVRDRVVFTNKRIIAINVQGIGMKKDYTNLPYAKIQYYSFETAGFMDLDAELTLCMSGKPNDIIFELRGSSNIKELCRTMSEYVL